MPQCPFCNAVTSERALQCVKCGASLPGDGSLPASADLESRLRQLLVEGQKIEAIRIYRESTGVDLARAKAAVELVEQGRGLPRAAGNPDFDDKLSSLLQRGQMIPAIKLFRERTGAGLAEAKAAVEAMERTLRTGGAPVAADAHDGELLELLHEGKKIEAIKRYRERHGVGLKEAKDAVEEMARRHGMTRQGRGCLGAVALACGLLTAVLCWAL